MKLVNLKLGDLILVKPADMLAVCWPTSQLENSQISFSKSLLDLNGMQVVGARNVLVTKLDKSKCESASEITVELLSEPGLLDDNEDSINELDLIIAFLKEVYVNKYLLSNQQISIVYMGKRLIFEIKNVVKNKGKNKKVNSSIEVISEQLKNTNLSGGELQKSGFSDQLEPVLNQGNTDLVPIYKEICLVCPKTVFKFVKHVEEASPQKENEHLTLFRDLAGLDKEIGLLKEIFFNPFEFADVYKQIGI